MCFLEKQGTEIQREGLAIAPTGICHNVSVTTVTSVVTQMLIVNNYAILLKKLGGISQSVQQTAKHCGMRFPFFQSIENVSNIPYTNRHGIEPRRNLEQSDFDWPTCATSECSMISERYLGRYPLVDSWKQRCAGAPF